MARKQRVRRRYDDQVDTQVRRPSSSLLETRHDLAHGRASHGAITGAILMPLMQMNEFVTGEATSMAKRARKRSPRLALHGSARTAYCAGCSAGVTLLPIVVPGPPRRARCSVERSWLGGRRADILATRATLSEVVTRCRVLRPRHRQLSAQASTSWCIRRAQECSTLPSSRPTPGVAVSTPELPAAQQRDRSSECGAEWVLPR